MELIASCFTLWQSRLNGARTAQFVATALPKPPQKAMTHFRNGAFLIAAVLILPPAALPQTVRPPLLEESTNHPEILFVQAASVKGGRLSERFPSGSRIVRLSRDSNKPTNLTPNFFAAADPRISFDGSKVLFAGKKDAAATWQIWEMNTDGTGQRQVTHCDGNCLSPAYLPRDAIAFSGEVQDAGGSRAYQIHFGKLDGSDVHPITFGPGDYDLETVLQNGLILVSARSPLQAKGGSRVRAISIRCGPTAAGWRRSDATTRRRQFGAKLKSWMTGPWFSSRTRCLVPKPGAIWRRLDVAPPTIQLWAPRAP